MEGQVLDQVVQITMTSFSARTRARVARGINVLPVIFIVSARLL